MRRHAVTILRRGRRCRGPCGDVVATTSIAALPQSIAAIHHGVVVLHRSYQTAASSSSSSKTPFYGAPRPVHNDSDAAKTSALSRWKLAAKSAVKAWWDPTRAGDVAVLGDITATYALHHMQQIMRQDPTGRRILQDRPLVNRQQLPSWIIAIDQATTSTVDHNDAVIAESTANDKVVTTLSNNTDVTFGQAYANFLRQHGFDPDERSPVQYIDDSELAYIMLRYRQCHDYWHTLTGLPPTILGEVGLKWLELFQTGLPVAALSATAGSLRLFSHQDRQMVFERYVPWAIRTSQQLSTPLINVYYEEEFDTPLIELRQRLRIEPAPR